MIKCIFQFKNNNISLNDIAQKYTFIQILLLKDCLKSVRIIHLETVPSSHYLTKKGPPPTPFARRVKKQSIPWLATFLSWLATGSLIVRVFSLRNIETHRYRLNNVNKIKDKIKLLNSKKCLYFTSVNSRHFSRSFKK